MITIKGKRLDKADRKELREFINYALGLFVDKSTIDKTNITIKFVDSNTLKGQDQADLKKYHAWMTRKNHNTFEIVVDHRMIGKRAYTCVGHEMIHVKQYLLGELKDFSNGDAWYMGERYKDWEYGEGYWFSPWELEAYSYELALYECFKAK